MSRYESAREIYESLGVDTEKAIETLRSTAVSVHCWQGDDVTQAMPYLKTAISPTATRSSRAILKNGSSSQRNAAWESISIPHSSRTRW